MVIVLVDDDADDRFLLEDGLKSRGVKASFLPLADAEEALRRIAVMAAEGRPPDLVLADSQMPRLGGLELFRRLRADPSTRGIPGVLLSSSNYGPEEDSARTLGVPLYRKPIDDGEYTELVALLERVVPGLAPGKATGV